MASLFSFIKRNRTALNPPVSPTPESPIKFGILGAAAIAPIALISPASNHSETIVYAVAARDKVKAEAFGKKHGIEKVYHGLSGYQELLDDPEVDAVYNPLPNGLHYEWTMKALTAGKHVLLEKPSSNTAEETRNMFELADRKNLVLLEAFHYRFHPAIQRVKAILDSGELGPIKNLSASLTIPSGIFKKTDIRLDYGLGGGALMDMGCYTISSVRYLASADPISVLTATSSFYGSLPAANEPIDTGTRATLAFPNDVTASINCDFDVPWRFGFIPRVPDLTVNVECERGSVELFNFIAPVLYHWIRVRTDDPSGKGKTKERIEKTYKFQNGEKGEEWWTTYRYQFESFVDRLKGRTPQHWMSKEESVGNIEWIEKVYEKSGFGSRPKSQYVHSE